MQSIDVYIVISPGNLSYPYGIKGVRTTSTDAHSLIEQLRSKHGGCYDVVHVPSVLIKGDE